MRVGASILPDGVPETGHTLVLDRRQRDTLQALIMDLELGEWAARGFELDSEDPDEQQARRARMERAFAILDDLDRGTDDPRDAAIEDVHADRKAGVPVNETAPALLKAAERLGVVAGLLQRL